MADGPAALVVDEEHRREQLPGRYPGLGPGVALVVGEQDMAAITDHDQALAGVGGADQQALAGLGRFGGVLVGTGGLHAAGPRAQCQRQCRCQWPGAAPVVFPHDCPLGVFIRRVNALQALRKA